MSIFPGLTGFQLRRVPAADGSRRVRLLNVVATFMCGGTENQFMALGRSLDPDRFDLEFACLRRRGAFVDELVARRIPLFEYEIATFRSAKAVAQQVRLARHIARRRIDIVHCYSFYGNVFAIPPARAAGAPVVIASIRDRAPYLTPMQKRAQRLVCRLADRILVNADAVKDWLIAERYDTAKIVVIRNGVDVRSERPAVSERILNELGLPPRVPLVGVVSRLQRLKGLEPFLEAAAVVARRFREVRFLIVGDAGPEDRSYRAGLTELAWRLGLGDRVVFAGLRTDVPELLACVTVSVMPSLDEALSNALLESMAAGVPVVATRVGGTPEAIEDGVTGVLVPPNEPDALANAICRVLADPSLGARLGRAARQAAAERFSTRQMVQATEQLYESLLEERARATPLRSTELASRQGQATGARVNTP
jgi:glycosyltransferase involved in cell wall biosynthesis